MSVKKYLTLNGLTYFLNKVKTYLTSSTYLNSIGISNSDIDDIADDAGYSSGSLPASEDIFITGDIIPNTDNSVDLGASSKNIKMIYTKGITINGTQFLPSDYATLSNLSAVATSGSYNDLSNKPTVPTKVSDLQNDSNFISNEALQSHAENASHLSASDREKIDNLITNTFAQETFASIASLNSHVNNSSVHLSQSQINTWNSKANASHTHSISDITDLQSELDDIRAEITAVKETGGIRAMENSEIGELSWN